MHRGRLQLRHRTYTPAAENVTFGPMAGTQMACVDTRLKNKMRRSDAC